MKEEVLHFGPGGRLLGILSHPADPRPGAPATLLLNSGLIHRVGPSRLYVQLARELASRGFYSLRFDLSGLGDSPLPSTADGLSIEDRTQLDILSAMQSLGERVGVEQFVLMGLCSGAFMAHRAAVDHERVVGCAQFDGHIFPTRGYRLRHYLPRLFKIGPWLRLVRRKVAPEPAVATGPEQDEDLVAHRIGRDEFASDVARLVERGTKLLFVLTRGGLQEVNYRRQLHDCVPGVDLDRHADVLHIPDSDHTLTLSRHRTTAVQHFGDWMERSFP